MNAFTYERYGSPQTLALTHLEKPTPKAREILVNIDFISLNPADWRLLRADPFFVRFEQGLLKPHSPILGGEIGGRVAAVGSQVTRFQVGDEVFGEIGTGGFADYVCVAADKLTHKPAGVSLENTSTLTLAGGTALKALTTFGELQAGQTVLINGASGGVGTFAIQLAKILGATTTAVCSSRNLSLVHTLGADNAIDYTTTDFTAGGRTYDLIIDNVGNRSVAELNRILTPKGRCALVGFATVPHLLKSAIQAAWFSANSDKKIGLMTLNPTAEDRAYLAQLLQDGQIQPVIDRRYPFQELPQALTYLETGRARGKVIVTHTT